MRLGKKIGQAEFVKIVNDELESLGYGENLLNLSTINRLTLFGRHTASANSLKLLESLPLLHVVSEKYSEDDLKRIALGQPSSSKDEVIVHKNELQALRSSLAKAMAMIDSLTGNEFVATYQYEVNLSPERKQYIFRQIINYKENLNKILQSGLLTESELQAYQQEDVPDHVLISLIASLELPGPVILMLRQMSGEFDNHDDSDDDF